jgi:hypothetical protein
MVQIPGIVIENSLARCGLPLCFVPSWYWTVNRAIARPDNSSSVAGEHYHGKIIESSPRVLGIGQIFFDWMMMVIVATCNAKEDPRNGP